MFAFSSGIPSPDIRSVQIVGVEVRFYALFILAGIAVAVWITARRLKGHQLPSAEVLDIALWAVPFGIVGGRIYHVVTHPGDYFYPGADLWRTLYVWEGGLAIFGAIVFGSVGIALGCRRSGIPFLAFADALAPGMLIAQAFGRLGNYFNQELYGTPTTLPWGLHIAPASPAFPEGYGPDTLFHPLFLYEMLWNLAGAGVLVLIDRKVTLRPGQLLGGYMVTYGAGRAWFESFRLDPTELVILGVKFNLLAAAIFAALGAALIIVQARRERTASSDRAAEAERNLQIRSTR